MSHNENQYSSMGVMRFERANMHPTDWLELLAHIGEEKSHEVRIGQTGRTKTITIDYVDVNVSLHAAFDEDGNELHQ